jgi:hypothetical protein
MERLAQRVASIRCLGSGCSPGWWVLAFAVVASSAAGCGDCLSLGYIAIDLTVVDAATGAPVPLGGAVIEAASPERREAVATGYLGSRNLISICCLKGRVKLRVQAVGYAAWDSTVVVPVTGSCDIPVRQKVIVRAARASGDPAA